jgi:hypothetical protein
MRKSDNMRYYRKKYKELRYLTNEVVDGIKILRRFRFRYLSTDGKPYDAFQAHLWRALDSLCNAEKELRHALNGIKEIAKRIDSATPGRKDSHG